MKYTLEQCLEVQKQVDASIKHNGEYNPIRAARAETVEMQEWLGLIKTWGENQINMKQAFMELVDVQAFDMSALIIAHKGDVKEIISFVELVENQNKHLEMPAYLSVDTDSLCDCFTVGAHNFELYKALMIIKTICINHFKRPATDIYYYYMGKKTLTQFRQDNGYKEGTYIKMWGNREDNEFLTDALEKGIEIEEIPAYLKENYERLVIAKSEVE